MNLSFTLDEKIFTDISPENIIERAINVNISSLEVSPDTDILKLEEYKNIIKCASNRALDVNYHIPYFANNIYELEHFTEYKDKVKNKYLEFLNLLELFQNDIRNSPVIVIHGANYTEENKSSGMENTLNFLDFFLNQISRRNLPFIVALETLRKKDIRNTLDNRDDLFYLLNQFKSDKLKVCWDMCHDKLNFYPKKTKIDASFLSQVVYAHIHGHNISTDLSHLSLLKSDLDYSIEIESLKNTDFKGCINIELLSNCDKTTYLSDLFKDINYLNRYI